MAASALSQQVKFLLSEPEITRRVRNVHCARKDWEATNRDVTASDVIDLCCRIGHEYWTSLYARDAISLEVFEAIADVRLTEFATPMRGHDG